MQLLYSTINMPAFKHVEGVGEGCRVNSKQNKHLKHSVFFTETNVLTLFTLTGFRNMCSRRIRIPFLWQDIHLSRQLGVLEIRDQEHGKYLTRKQLN